MPAPPSDRKILQAIYDRYYAAFASFSQEGPSRSSKIYVPVDLNALCNHFGVDVDIIFGRLYYYLNHKFGYTQSDGSKVYLFTPKAGADPNCVNMPLLASVLAGMREEHRKDLWALWIAIASLALSIASFVVSVSLKQ